MTYIQRVLNTNPNENFDKSMVRFGEEKKQKLFWICPIAASDKLTFRQKYTNILIKKYIYIENS